MIVMEGRNERGERAREGAPSPGVVQAVGSGVRPVMALVGPCRYAGITHHCTPRPSLVLRHATWADGATRFIQASYCSILSTTAQRMVFTHNVRDASHVRTDGLKSYSASRGAALYMVYYAFLMGKPCWSAKSGTSVTQLGLEDEVERKQSSKLEKRRRCRLRRVRPQTTASAGPRATSTASS